MTLVEKTPLRLSTISEPIHMPLLFAAANFLNNDLEIGEWVITKGDNFLPKVERIDGFQDPQNTDLLDVLYEIGYRSYNRLKPQINDDDKSVQTAINLMSTAAQCGKRMYYKTMTFLNDNNVRHILDLEGTEKEKERIRLGEKYALQTLQLCNQAIIDLIT